MKPLSRRTFGFSLGLGAASGLLTPIARGLIAEARGETSTVKRYISFCGGNGLDIGRVEAAVGKGPELKPTGIMTPLAPHAKDLLALVGLSGTVGQLHGNGESVFTLVEPTACCKGVGFVPGGISIDRHIAKTVSKGRKLSSVNLGILDTQSGGGDVEPNTLSADGPGQPFPAIYDPIKAFAAIFGGAMGSANPGTGSSGGTPPVDLLLKQKKSLLDFVLDDTQRLKQRLAAPERVRLDQYLESLREIESRLKPTVGAPEVVDAATCSNMKAPSVGQGAPKSPQYLHVSPPVVYAHIDIAVMAVACGLTNVATIFTPPGATHMGFVDLPGAGNGQSHHNLHHNAQVAELTVIDTWFMTAYERIISKVKSFPDAAGTLLDSTLVLSANASGGAHHNGQKSHTILLAGSLGGKIRTGRSMRFAPGTELVGPYLSILQAFGLQDANKFGSQSGTPTSLA
ncbi:MAG: DUF1552 domain-containing protein [Deltaproteobacteria bacterium]|nr:DUF1552 domain-containing protein [Deltaproteobacteria bacterium]